jgi:hypothetical protein
MDRTYNLLIGTTRDTILVNDTSLARLFGCLWFLKLGLPAVWLRFAFHYQIRDPICKAFSSINSNQTYSLFETRTTTMLAVRSRGRPTNSSTRLPTAEPHANQGVIWAPSVTVDDSSYEQAVLHMIAAGRPTNTSKQYDGKVSEYSSYCDSVYPMDPYRQNLCASKVYRFIFYQAMRNKKKRGGGTIGTDTATVSRFDCSDYDTVMENYRQWLRSPTETPVEPDNPVGERMIAAYKTALHWVYKDQVARRVCGLTWDQIWTLPLLNLHNLVKIRRSTQDKKNYVEKIDQDFAPYQIAEEFPRIERAFWERGSKCLRSAYAWLRHRFCVLFSTSGILRCESLYKAELSDFLGLRMKKKTDVHRLYLMIMQIATGKTRVLLNCPNSKTHLPCYFFKSLIISTHRQNEPWAKALWSCHEAQTG